MPFTGKAGDSFYLADINGRHRWVILTKPDATGCVIIVNFTDTRHEDCPVIFSPGDHKAFTKRTTIACERATSISLEKLLKIRLADYEYFNERQLAKIVKGVMENVHTPGDIIAELREQYPDY